MEMKRVIMSAMLSVVLTACAVAKDKVGLVFVGNSITQGALLADPQHDAPPVKAAGYVADKSGFEVEFGLIVKK